MTQTASRTAQTTDPQQHLRGGGQDGGKITVADGVVQKIAGMAAREVSGVYAMGSGAARTVGAIKERIPGSTGASVSQGVGVEVGENEAAVDLDIVVEYGVSANELGRGIQRNVRSSIERMTGLDVVEVNVNINDVHLPDDGDGASGGSATSTGESRVS
ncbi:Asp23/Gls24 family envelope stress response protein [Asanoa sp. WMMD1127]|uniref:Asp23/Gls24 family envelope stress response protein n=1 Tax=Asanoa sp. WMMD1127 TaxID=3016107 RepID=UPI00241774B3|nr:Asp23/Gls24 family envelope stress response protein [Asanoa sp. WMMD1127]MDG4825902.1 Asp23/Gls24 family envelope stress response protein [Asanoa sp. WMMD1127]